MNTTGKIEESKKELVAFEATKREIIRGLFIFLLVGEVFLFLRIIFRAIGANPGTAFGGFIYTISGFFLLPFFGIFPQLQDEIVAGKSALDAQAFLAFFCYLVLIPLAMAVVSIVINMLKTRKQADEIIEKDNPVDPSEIDNMVK